MGSTRKVSDEMNTVPEVPRLMLHRPSPTVPVPMAAAALSPAPAQTVTVPGRPSARAASGSSVPTGCQLSYSAASHSGCTPQISHIRRLQHLCSTSSSSIPDASE